ncbi:MAG: hypothetical protein ACXVLQ_19200, partial [Bacteriovorax sp.]
IASHTYYHKDVNLEIEEVFRLDLVKSISSIRALTTSLGYPKYETYFRFPGGAYGERDDYHHLNVLRSVSYELFRENCINVVFWDDGVPDYCPGATANQIKDGLLANLFGGSSFTCQLNSDGTAVMTPVEIKSSLGGGVIIMHDTHESVSEATELLLQEVASRNMKVIPLNTVSNFMYTGKGCHW